MTLHAKSACDVYLMSRDGLDWNSDDLKLIRRNGWIKKNGVVEDSFQAKYIIHHKQFVSDEKVMVPSWLWSYGPKTRYSYGAFVTIFVK